MINFNKRITILYCLFSLFVITGGCKNDNVTSSASSLKTALVLDYHPVAADGCGFLIRIDSVIYHPDNLTAQFQKDSLTVKIKYALSGTKFQCGMSPDNALPVIHIEHIE